MTQLDQLKQAFKQKKRVLVMYSGGLDSTLLAKLAFDALSNDALALTIDSPIIPRREIEEAKSIAFYIGIPHALLALDEIEQDVRFAENLPDRCYICRKLRNEVVRCWARDHSYETIADGLNYSDFNDYRPGMKASSEDNIWQPFVEFNLAKDDIRIFSKELGLPGWDRPNTVCLCSRFPYGYRLEKEQIQRVEAAENYLYDLGFRSFRLRSFPYDMAVLELEDPEKALPYKTEIVSRLKELGFVFVTLDLEGFRSGKMNRIIIRDRE
jgi:uncharacterized protein